MSTELLDSLSQYGALGVLAAMGFVLFFFERRQSVAAAAMSQENLKRNIKIQISYANHVEHLAETVESIGHKLDAAIDKMERHVQSERLEAAREDGRRSATDPIGVRIIPVKGED